MKRFSDEWREADSLLTDPLKPHFLSFDMGAYLFGKDERRVSVKHRMTKSKIAVVSLGCWVKIGDGSADYPDIKWFKTVAMPTGEQAETITQAFLAYLADGSIPSLELETYPGYEDLDEKSNKGTR
jgi:hypothetical protein